MTTTARRLIPVLLLALSAVARIAAQDHPDLSGSWELNPEKSASSTRSPSGGYNRSPGDRGDPRGGGGPMGRRPGSVSVPNEDEYPMPKGDAAVRELLRAKQHLDIALGDSGVQVKDDAGWARWLAPGRGKLRDEESQGGAAEVESEWKGDKLVTERRLDRGVTIRETFEYNRKSNELVVELEMRMERGPKPIQLRRVYDRMVP